MGVILRRLMLAAGALFGLGAATLAGVAVGREWHLAHDEGWRAISPPPDVILVLGGGATGGTCAIVANYRLMRALTLAAEIPGTTILYSDNHGGIAPLARAHLVRTAEIADLPVPKRIMVEPKAVSTFENMRYSASLLPDGSRVLIVTDAFHLLRARILWRYFGGAWPSFAVATEGRSDRRQIELMVREAAAWWLNLAKVGGWVALGWAGLDEAEREGLIR